jgi:N-methylhydantoinase A
MGYRIGIDVGGTFTDFVLVRPARETLLHKESTTPADEAIGVLAGIGALARGERLELRELLARTDLIAHGTTTADNTLIQMNGATTGLVTTEGHRDQIEIRRGYKEEIWDPAYPPPVPIAPRRRRFGVPERLDFRGEVVRPLDEGALRRAIRRLKKQGVESIAVCFLFSYVNPAHERRAREIVQEEHPDARVSLSHEIMPAAPEFERTSTTLVDAYVRPRVQAYLERLQRALGEAGYPRDLLVMQSSGGVMTADFVAGRPVATLGSGPAGGIMAVCSLASQSTSTKKDDFIAVDMGGTSYEACLVRAGTPKIKSSWNWVQRYLVGLPTIDFHSIGAGGGSIAQVEAGILKVGPRSAGAQPGPICYGRGGTEPTVTDANVLLGYVSPVALCGGEFKLKSEGVRAAIAEKIGRPLGLDPEQAAYGILRIVNANMANAIRRVSSQAGHDPRAFAMLVYGGNGPVHAGAQAQELGIRKYVVPRASAAFSALGLLLADHVVDGTRAYIAPAKRASAAALSTLFGELEEEAAAAFARAGVPRAELRPQRYLAMSYPGQTFEVQVPMNAGEDIARVVERFHDMHEETHAYAARDEEPVVRAAVMKTFGRSEKPPLPPLPAATAPLSAALTARRRVYFAGSFVDTPVYAGERLGPGHRLEGPAIVEERFTTIVVHPGHKGEIDPFGNVVVTL